MGLRETGDPPTFLSTTESLPVTNRQGLWVTLLAAVVILLALIGFWPSPVDAPAQGFIAAALRKLHAHGVPRWFDYGFIEKASNIALFVPLGVAAALAMPEKKWWQISALGLLVSGCMELGQWLFLPARFPTGTDLVTNTFGAVIGVFIAASLTRKPKTAGEISPPAS